MRFKGAAHTLHDRLIPNDGLHMGGYYASMLGRVVGFRLLVRAAGAHKIHAHSELFVENAFHAQPLGDAHHQPRPQRLALRRILAQFAFDPLLSQILTAGWAADETVQTSFDVLVSLSNSS